MRSNYKKLGTYIRLVNERNSSLTGHELLGVSIKKSFMPSIANTIGTDMSTYKLIRKNQFAYGPVTSRNGDKISIALLDDLENALVSQAYIVFEIIDHNELSPEYLMMWFRRPEFDRYARFKSHGSAREIFDWNELCETELPIPSIEKQREIVREYNTIVNRISLNEQFIQKLEETAQAIYKQWFVDFDFPSEALAKDGVSQPYKSSGGKMVWCEELDKEIPEGWFNVQIQDLIDDEIIFKNQDGNHGEIHPKSSDYVLSGIPFIMAKDIKNGTIDIENCSFISRTQADKLRIDPAISGDVLITHKATMGRVAIVPEIKDYIVLTPQVTYYRVKDIARINKEFLYCLFNSYGFQEVLLGVSEQSTRNFLSITNQRLLKVLLPTGMTLHSFKEVVKPIIEHKNILNKELNVLNRTIQIINAKMTKVEETTEKEIIQ